MTDITTIIDSYLAAYCDADPARRSTLIAAAWADNSALIDPPFDGAGHEGIAAMTEIVLQHYPGHTFRRTTNVDVHHTFGRYEWVLENADGVAATSGTDFVEIDDAGQLIRVVGFFGDLTPQED